MTGPGIGRSWLVIETFVACALLAGCSDDHPTSPVPAATPTEVAPANPVQTATVPTPHPTRPPKANFKEPDAGDERPIGVPVTVLVTTTRIRVTRGATVPAFLPLRVRVVSRLPGRVTVRVIQAGGDGTSLGEGRVGRRGRVAFRVTGAQPGSLEILSPDLNPDRTAFVKVRRTQ